MGHMRRSRGSSCFLGVENSSGFPTRITQRIRTICQTKTVTTVARLDRRGCYSTHA